MGKTIIQTIGPLYGEVVNGTVFGRPNGSVYVPIQNIIKQSIEDSMKFVRYNSAQGAFVLCNSAGQSPFSAPALQLNTVAESQDLQNYIALELSDTSNFTKVAQSILGAGLFNVRSVRIAGTDPADPVFTIEAGTTYYQRAILYSASGVPVATSETIEFVGVVN